MNDDDGKINRMIDPLVTSGLDAVVFSEKGLILKDILSISSYVNSYSVCNKGRYIIILSQDGDLDTLNLFDVTKNKVINILSRKVNGMFSRPLFDIKGWFSDGENMIFTIKEDISQNKITWYVFNVRSKTIDHVDIESANQSILFSAITPYGVLKKHQADAVIIKNNVISRVRLPFLAHPIWWALSGEEVVYSSTKIENGLSVPDKWIVLNVKTRNYIVYDKEPDIKYKYVDMMPVDLEWMSNKIVINGKNKSYLYLTLKVKSPSDSNSLNQCLVSTFANDRNGSILPDFSAIVFLHGGTLFLRKIDLLSADLVKKKCMDREKSAVVALSERIIYHLKRFAFYNNGYMPSTESDVKKWMDSTGVPNLSEIFTFSSLASRKFQEDKNIEIGSIALGGGSAIVLSNGKVKFVEK
jgi:hypothetical protein